MRTYTTSKDRGNIRLTATKKTRQIDGYDRLIEGICRQATSDILEGSRYQRRDAITFYRSKWFYLLTGLNGYEIVDKLLRREQK